MDLKVKWKLAVVSGVLLAPAILSNGVPKAEASPLMCYQQWPTASSYSVHCGGSGYDFRAKVNCSFAPGSAEWTAYGYWTSANDIEWVWSTANCGNGMTVGGTNSIEMR